MIRIRIRIKTMMGDQPYDHTKLQIWLQIRLFAYMVGLLSVVWLWDVQGFVSWWCKEKGEKSDTNEMMIDILSPAHLEVHDARLDGACVVMETEKLTRGQWRIRLGGRGEEDGVGGLG